MRRFKNKTYSISFLMKFNYRLRVFSLVLLAQFFFIHELYSQSSRFFVNSARNAALGGAHAALTDQFSTIFNNAAGYKGVKSDFTVAEIAFEITGPVSSIVLASQEGDFDQILSDLGTTQIGFEMIGPISLGVISKDMAFGFYNVINTDIFIPDIDNDAELNVRFDLGAVYGYSFGTDFVETNSQLNLGFLVKLFTRSEMNISKSLEDIFSELGDLASLLSPDSLPFNIGFGVGVDIGMKYIWNDTISVGIALRDIYTPLFMFRYDSMTSIAGGGDPQFNYSTVAPDYSIGFMYSPDITLFNGLITNIKLMLDYNDIFDFAFNSAYKRHILLHFGAGVEFVMFDILSLRLGFSEGLPSAGLGLDIHVFKINFALFGRELGSQPGNISVYNLMIGLEFSY